jgi:hypothetical protein
MRPHPTHDVLLVDPDLEMRACRAFYLQMRGFRVVGTRAADDTLRQLRAGFRPYSWSTAFSSKVTTLNSTSFAGHADWRLPNVNELQSLIDYGTFNPAVSGAFNSGCGPGCPVTTCSCTRSFYYWPSTSSQSSPTLAWTVFFGSGLVGNTTSSTRIERSQGADELPSVLRRLPAHAVGPQALRYLGDTLLQKVTGKTRGLEIETIAELAKRNARGVHAADPRRDLGLLLHSAVVQQSNGVEE